jgi:hypothetical protein
MKQRSPTSRKWPCLFGEISTKDIDSRVDKLWPGRTPFGDLRNQWRRHHCRTLNPYGSESCPYPLEDCGAAFLQAVEITLEKRPNSPVGYFIKVAKTEAAKRADRKGIQRGLTGHNNYGSILRTGVPNETPEDQGPGHAGPATEDSKSRQRMRSSQAGPIRIGEVLGSIDPRSHPRPTPNGEEGTE